MNPIKIPDPIESSYSSDKKTVNITFLNKDWVKFKQQAWEMNKTIHSERSAAEKEMRHSYYKTTKYMKNVIKKSINKEGMVLTCKHFDLAGPHPILENSNDILLCEACFERIRQC